MQQEWEFKLSKKEFQVGGPQATYVLIICSTLYMINYMDRQVLSVVLQPMKIALELSDAQAGWIQSGFLLSMGICAVPLAYLVDRWGRSKSIGIMAIVWSIATFMTGRGKSFIGVLIPRLITGTGEAAFSSGSVALISASYSPEERAKKMGIFNMFLVFGAGGGMVMGGYLSVNHGGWPTPFYVFAIPGIVFGILAFFMQDYPNTPPGAGYEKQPSFFDNAKELMKIRSLVWLYVGYAMHNVMSFAFLVWTPALLMRRFTISEETAGVVMAIAGVLSIPGSLYGGVIADAWQKRDPAGRMKFAAIMEAVCSTTILLSIICVFFLHKGDPENISVWLVAGVLLYAVFVMGSIAGIPAVNAATQDVVSTRMKGMSYGLSIFFMYLLGGGWSPLLTGYLSDLFGGEVYGLAYALMIVGSAGYAGFAFWWKSSQYYADDIKRVSEVEEITN